MSMDPRTPDLLSRLCGIANAMIRAQDEGKLRPDERRDTEIGQIYGELVAIHQYRATCGYDRAAIMLAECLALLEKNAAPLGDSEQATKWRYLAKSFLGFVQADMAVAITVRPATSDHDFQRG